MRLDLTPWTPHRTAPTGSRLATFDAPFGRLFDDLFRGLEAAPTAPAVRLDVRETDEAYRVDVELPGVAEEDVELTWSEGVLTIAGEKKATEETDQNGVRRTERSYGSFRRQIALPHDVDADKVEATFERGVLTVRLPKTDDSERVKRIAIQKG